MKKISLVAILVTTVVSASVANASPENGFYLGTDIGGSLSAHKDVYRHLAEKYDQDVKFKNEHLLVDIRAGYKFSPYFATELSVGHLGRFKAKLKPKTGSGAETFYNYSFNDLTLFAKGIYPINKELDLYTKLGFSVINTKYTDNIIDNNPDYSIKKKGKNTYSLPVAVGAEFAVIDNLTANVEYQYMHRVRHNLASKVGGIDKLPAASKDVYTNRFNDFKPSVHAVKVGLTYYFGAQKDVAASPVVEPEPTSVSLASEDLFKFGNSKFQFGSYKLSSHGIKVIGELAKKIKKEQTDDQTVVVAGHADRIGSAEFNLKLSEKRANTVAKQLIANGVHNVSAIGYGFNYPVTDGQCANIKDREALIKCYAPDRRVEVSISGKKKQDK